ncbi:hydrogenase maturation nickel metallochaperone HypA/HybF [Dethiosulfovibrio salsuginis]|uniref:Hydrogenase maturation factor HypA n=1 Tax=Dethiosulfovibrio salsuginis TaxID=561720 RepID=A0A1X7ICW6_9BACT|nr:hydrogenase maturation nickel metallochaperone HypA [Dethiosulfovibrio salsuginis]SMG12100.1 hydrogenase nickel incorporation protein HypA/HybF [Dethiosulfovibrio salsuginis]
MHELSMVKAIIDALEELQDRNNWSSIRSVNLKVGSMRQVIPHILRFAFNASIERTSLAGAELIITPVPVEFSCRSCGGRWGEADLGYLCPHCGGKDVDMVQGMEMDIDSLEVEE